MGINQDFIEINFEMTKKQSILKSVFLFMSLHCVEINKKFKFDASLDGCWAKSGYQDGNIVNQGFIFPNVYGDGICDEKMNIYECNFDGGDCCKAVTADFRCYKEGCNCHLFGLPAPSIFGDT